MVAIVMNTRCIVRDGEAVRTLRSLWSMSLRNQDGVKRHGPIDVLCRGRVLENVDRFFNFVED